MAFLAAKYLQALPEHAIPAKTSAGLPEPSLPSLSVTRLTARFLSCAAPLAPLRSCPDPAP